MYKDPIIVLSTGRAGSSLVAGMLAKLGVHMGEEWIPADKTNPAGFFEDKAIKNNNLSLISGQITEQDFVDKTKRIKHNRGVNNNFWGFKVPSTAQLLDKYEEIFNSPKYIICDRPEDEVVASMQKCYGWSEDYCRNLINIRAKRIKKRQGLKLTHKEIIKHPAKTVDKLIKYLGLNPNKKQRQQAIDLVCTPPKDPKILIATPNLGWIRREVMNALFNIKEDDRYEKEMMQPIVVPYELNVNQIISNTFLPGDYDFLLLIDADNPPHRNPLDLVALNKDIIGLPTPTRSGESKYFNVMTKVDNGFIPNQPSQGLQEVDAVGSGCMLIRRDVLEKFDFTPEWMDGLRRRTGDFNLCTKVRENGGKVYAHWSYLCSHIKEGDILEEMNKQ